MTRSDARILKIDVNGLTDGTPSKKRKINNDDRKEATKRMKVDSQSISNNGNAEKKRQLYKTALGLNGNGRNSGKLRALKPVSATPKVDNVSNAAQLECLPPKNGIQFKPLEKTLEFNSNHSEAEKAQELPKPIAPMPIEEASMLNVAPLAAQLIHSPQNDVVARIDFKVNEVIWCKIRGYPSWPCKIKTFVKNMVIVVWFNDYRITKVYRTQLQKFLVNFDTNAKNFDNNIVLKTAAREALLFYGSGLSA